MSKHIRTLLAILGIAALMVSVVAVMSPKATTAANLTGGNYTYLIDGEEVTFTFDPVVTKEGLLLPIELFQKFGINVENAGKTITLSKDTVSVQLTLGSATMTTGGMVKVATTAPLRLNGRLFVPADPLREFGIDFSQDGNYVILHNFTDYMPDPKQMADGDWNMLKSNHTLTASIKADSGSYIYTEFTLLTPDIVNAANLDISYGTRARLNGLLKTNTLVLTKLSNLSTKAGAFVNNSVALTDDQRNQYDLDSILDIGSGLLTNKVAPGATRMGVLVFPKALSTAATLSLYYDNNAQTLGSFPVIK